MGRIRFLGKCIFSNIWQFDSDSGMLNFNKNGFNISDNSKMNGLIFIIQNSISLIQVGGYY